VSEGPGRAPQTPTIRWTYRIVLLGGLALLWRLNAPGHMSVDSILALHEGRFHPSLGGIGPCREPHLQPAPLVAIGARREHEQRARVGWRDPVPCRATRLRAHGGATDQLHAPRLSVRRPRRVARGGGGGSDEHERHKRRDGEPPHPRSLIARRVIRHHPRQAINQAGLDR